MDHGQQMMQRRRLHAELLEAHRQREPLALLEHDREEDLLYQHLLEHIAMLHEEVHKLRAERRTDADIARIARRDTVRVLSSDYIHWNTSKECWECIGYGRKPVFDEQTKQWTPRPPGIEIPRFIDRAVIYDYE